ncbi:hypothetical protein, partial [Lishizhenia sp.]|uniref:hypothetical protein n=1 Tax=Lishizhenia sp. TaxID=2497594 RepID=UPI00299D083E
EIDKSERLEKLESVKAKLDDLFEKKHGKGGLTLWKNNKAFYAQPILQMAAVVILIVIFFNNLNFNKESSLAMKQESKKEYRPEPNSVVLEKEEIKQKEEVAPEEINPKEQKLEEPEEVDDQIQTEIAPEVDAFAKVMDDIPEVNEEAEELNIILSPDEKAKYLESNQVSSVQLSSEQNEVIYAFSSSPDAAILVNDSLVGNVAPLNTGAELSKSLAKKVAIKRDVKLEDKQDEFAILTPLF